MKEHVKILKYPEYSYKIVVIVTEDIVKSRAKRDDIIGYTFEGPEPLGLFSHPDVDFEGTAFLFLKPDSNINTISHEVVHMVKRIFDRIDTDLDDSTEELFAYQVGYNTERITKFVKKYKSKE